MFWRATAHLAERMVALLDPKPGQRLLELAAGPGDTGFLAARLVQPGGELLSTDVAPEMLEAGQRRAAALGLTNVRFAVEDAAALSLADDAADAILCRFGLMLVPEMEQVAAEIARVLAPGGRAVLAVWAGPELNPWMTVTGRAGVELGLVEPPDPDAPGPFRLADPERLRSVVTGGGLEVERIEDVPVTWTTGSLDEWWESITDMSPMLRPLVAKLSADEVSALRARSETHLQEHIAVDGSLTVPGLARVVAATAA